MSRYLCFPAKGQDKLPQDPIQTSRSELGSKCTRTETLASGMLRLQGTNYAQKFNHIAKSLVSRLRTETTSTNCIKLIEPINLIK